MSGTVLGLTTRPLLLTPKGTTVWFKYKRWCRQVSGLLSGSLCFSSVTQFLTYTFCCVAGI